MRRYYMGVDWADMEHAVWVEDERGAKVATLTVKHTAEGLSEFGRWVDERRAEGIELWAAIEKPEGRIIDFLLDHGVVVYPVNPKALDRARDRFRMSSAKSDPFDARVLAEFLRTDHAHLHPLLPNSEPAQELKLLTRDHQRQVRQQTRLLNQLTATLKEYYPRPLEVFEDLKTSLARHFLHTYPTPQVLDPSGRRRAHARAVEEVCPDAPAEPGPDRRALDGTERASAAGAGPRGARQGPAGLRPGRGAGYGGPRRGGVWKGDGGFFRRHAGG